MSELQYGDKFKVRGRQFMVVESEEQHGPGRVGYYRVIVADQGTSKNPLWDD